MAYVIPVIGHGNPERGELVLIVVLGPENLERMREGDPFDMQGRDLGPILLGRKMKELDLVIAYEEDQGFLMKAYKAGDVKALIAYIERGRVHRPEKGDATKPVSLRRPGGK